jgi:predicted nucleic acid-binding protein
MAIPLVFTPQVMRETWAVLTRPRLVNGYGLDPQTALQTVNLTTNQFVLVPDTADVYFRWLGILASINISGKQVHDAYHVAAMRAHGITKILTVDKRDFVRYADVQVIIPGGSSY